MIVERVQRTFGAGFERKPRQVGASPAEPANRLVAASLSQLVQTTVDGRIVLQQAVSLNDRIGIVPLSARGQPDQLDRTAGERTGDVAAELEHRIAIMLNEVVVVRRPLG